MRNFLINFFTYSSKNNNFIFLEITITDKNYCQIATNIFQRYADNNLEGKLLWESIKIDFEN